MSLRRIVTIYRKDLLDSIRDARILVTLITPLLIGIFYGYAFDDTSIPSATLVVYDPGASTLVDGVAGAVQNQVDLSVHRLESEEQVQQEIAEDKADLGLVIPEGFDAAVKDGRAPDLHVLLPEKSSIGGQYMLATLDPVLRSMADQPLPATLQLTTVSLDTGQLTIIDKMSMRTWSIVLSLVLMASMVALLAVPIILAEETEKKTIDALVLVSSYGEVVIAKAMIGISYVVVMTAVLLGITRLRPESMLWFLIATGSMAICLLGFGLLVGSVFKSATQLNTWSGLLLVPAVVPAGLIGFGLPVWIDRVAGLIPTGAAMKLLIDAFSDPPIFDHQWRILAVLIVWSVIFYALLLWQLSRRRA